MKRAMSGGAHRGPPAVRRQRRTLRIVQGLLVVLGAALLVVAGYSLGRASGIAAERAGGTIDPPRAPGALQTAALVTLGGGLIGAAFLLHDPRGGVRLPTPARLDDLVGRAEAVAVERAERAAASSSHDPGG